MVAAELETIMALFFARLFRLAADRLDPPASRPNLALGPWEGTERQVRVRPLNESGWPA